MYTKKEWKFAKKMPYNWCLNLHLSIYLLTIVTEPVPISQPTIRMWWWEEIFARLVWEMFYILIIHFCITHFLSAYNPISFCYIGNFLITTSPFVNSGLSLWRRASKSYGRHTNSDCIADVGTWTGITDTRRVLHVYTVQSGTKHTTNSMQSVGRILACVLCIAKNTIKHL